MPILEPILKSRLAAARIELLAQTESHILFTRDNFIALIERSSGTVGSTGMLTEHGLAYLVWRDGQAYLKSKSAEVIATEEQVTAIRSFSRDLQSAMGQLPDMLT